MESIHDREYSDTGNLAMCKRAAIYARVSTRSQAENTSLTFQLDACRHYAQTHGFTITHEVTDVRSGATLDRPGLHDVRKMIRHRTIDALIVYTLDRLSRNRGQAYLLHEERKHAGVQLHYVTSGEMHDTPEAGTVREEHFAEYEKIKIRERMNNGKRGKINSILRDHQESGIVTGRIPGYGSVPPYGYRFEGAKNHKRLMVVDEESDVVRLIYHLFVYGDANGPLSIREIAAKLTGMNVPTPTAQGRRQARQSLRGPGEWSTRSLYGILKDAIYAGTYYANRMQTTADGRDITRPRNEWIAFPVPAIIDRTLYEAAQQKLAQGRLLSKGGSNRDYLLRSRIRCACGYAMCGMATSKGITSYRCTGRNPGSARHCAMPKFNARQVEARVWHWIEEEVLDPEKLMRYIQHARAATEHQRHDVANQIDFCEHKRHQLDTELRRLLHLYRIGTFDTALLEEETQSVNDARTTLDAELARLYAQLHVVGPTDDEIASLLDVARIIREEPAALDRTAKRWIIDRLDLRVTCVIRDSVRYVDVTSNLTLSNMVSLALSTKDTTGKPSA